MDLLVAIAVWAAGAWLAYRWTRRRPPQPRRTPPPSKEPRRRQEGMDVRRRRGHV